MSKVAQLFLEQLLTFETYRGQVRRIPPPHFVCVSRGGVGVGSKSPLRYGLFHRPLYRGLWLSVQRSMALRIDITSTRIKERNFGVT